MRVSSHRSTSSYCGFATCGRRLTRSPPNTACSESGTKDESSSTLAGGYSTRQTRANTKLKSGEAAVRLLGVMTAVLADVGATMGSSSVLAATVVQKQQLSSSSGMDISYHDINDDQNSIVYYLCTDLRMNRTVLDHCDAARA